MADTIARISSLDFDSAWSLASESASEPIVLQNYVHGVFSAPAKASSDSWIDSYNPRTGKVFARIPSSTEAEVDEAVCAATDAFPPWSQTPRSLRSKTLMRIADLIHERRESFAIWESIDQGKPLERARVEVDRAVSNFRSVHGHNHAEVGYVRESYCCLGSLPNTSLTTRERSA